MKDKTLYKLSIICSITGILLLLILQPSPKTIQIKEITKEHLNKNIQIQGTIKQIETFNKLTLIKIKDQTGTITTTSFKPINLLPNQKVKIQGKVTEYNNNLQLQINKLITI